MFEGCEYGDPPAKWEVFANKSRAAGLEWDGYFALFPTTSHNVKRPYLAISRDREGRIELREPVGKNGRYKVTAKYPFEQADVAIAHLIFLGVTQVPVRAG